jgi:hypothetical protein
MRREPLRIAIGQESKEAVLFWKKEPKNFCLSRASARAHARNQQW